MLGVEVNAINLRDSAEIERGVAAFTRFPNGGLIVTASALSIVHRDLIIALAARYKLPAGRREQTGGICADLRIESGVGE